MEDMGERNTENVKQGNGNEYSDTRVNKRKIGDQIMQRSRSRLGGSALRK
jgi:hypothetical protein